MGVDIQTYRARIGLMGPGYFKYRHPKSVYCPWSTSPDIHLRMIVLCTYLLVLTQCCNIALRVCYSIKQSEFTGEDCCTIVGSSNMIQQQLPYMCNPKGTLIGSDSFSEKLNAGSFNLAQHLLMSAADVEVNHGPIDGDAMLTAFKSTENKMLQEIRSLKLDVAEVKSDVPTIKHEHQLIKNDIATLKNNLTLSMKKLIP